MQEMPALEIYSGDQLTLWSQLIFVSYDFYDNSELTPLPPLDPASNKFEHIFLFSGEIPSQQNLTHLAVLFSKAANE